MSQKNSANSNSYSYLYTQFYEKCHFHNNHAVFCTRTSGAEHTAEFLRFPERLQIWRVLRKSRACTLPKPLGIGTLKCAIGQKEGYNNNYLQCALYNKQIDNVMDYDLYTDEQIVDSILQGD